MRSVNLHYNHCSVNSRYTLKVVVRNGGRIHARNYASKIRSRHISINAGSAWEAEQQLDREIESREQRPREND